MSPILPAQLPALPVTQLTRARSDDELVASWLANMSSALTRAAFAASAKRFVSHLRAQGLTIHTATVEDVREAIAILSAGKAPSSAAQYARRVKSLLSYAHRLGYMPFNAGTVIRTKSGTVDRAKRIATET